MAAAIIPIYLLSDKVLDLVIFLLLTLPAVGINRDALSYDQELHRQVSRNR